MDRPVPKLRLATLLALSASAGLARADEAAALPAVEVGTYVRVQTLDGRTRRGFVDPRTGSEALWIRSEFPGTLLQSTIPWSNIARLTPTDPAAEFRPPRIFPILPVTFPGNPTIPPAVWPNPFDSGPAPFPLGAPVDPTFTPLTPPQSVLPGGILPQPSTGIVPSLPVPPPVGPQLGPGLRAPLETSCRVRTLRVRAQAANWNSNARVDGLRLLVQPISRDGSLAAVNGSLTVELVARCFSGVRNDDRIGIVQRWSRQIRASDFGPEGAVVELPYSRFHPLSAGILLPIGRINARLNVASVGSFNAAVDDVMLDSTGIIQDELQLQRYQSITSGLGEQAISLTGRSPATGRAGFHQ